MATVLLSLPDGLRSELKSPWGPIFEDPADLLSAAGRPLIAVGDVVAYHLEDAGARPDVALVDEKTERSAVPAHIRAAGGEPDVRVRNPAAALTEELLAALRDALDADRPIRIHVDGEEDLAALPAIVGAPDGASVVYGQPGAGMVLVTVAPETRKRAEEFLRRMDGDVEAALAAITA